MQKAVLEKPSLLARRPHERKDAGRNKSMIDIHRSFINSELKKITDYLKNYCLVDEKCIKLDIQV